MRANQEASTPMFTFNEMFRFSFWNGFFAFAGAAAVSAVRKHPNSSARAGIGAAGASAALCILLNIFADRNNTAPAQPHSTSGVDSALYLSLMTGIVAFGVLLVPGRSSQSISDVINASLGFAGAESVVSILTKLYNIMSAPEERSSTPRMAP